MVRHRLPLVVAERVVHQGVLGSGDDEAGIDLRLAEDRSVGAAEGVGCDAGLDRLGGLGPVPRRLLRAVPRLAAHDQHDLGFACGDGPGCVVDQRRLQHTDVGEVGPSGRRTDALADEARWIGVSPRALRNPDLVGRSEHARQPGVVRSRVERLDHQVQRLGVAARGSDAGEHGCTGIERHGRRS